MTKIRASVAPILVILSLIFCLTPTASAEVAVNPTVSDDQIEADWKSIEASGGQDRVKEMWQAGKALGLSDAALAGVMGNAWTESASWRPGLDGGSGCSYFQWIGGRRTNAEKLLGKSCKDMTPSDAIKRVMMDDEIGVVTNQLYADMTTKYHGAAKQALAEKGINVDVPSTAETKFESVDAFKSTNNYFLATWTFMTVWERPGSGSSFGARYVHAATVFKKMNGVGASSSSDSQKKKDNKGDEYDEWALPGMPDKPEYPEGGTVKIGTYNDLSVDDRANVSALSDQLKTETALDRDKKIGGVVALGGYLVIMWGVALFIGLAFDLVSPLGLNLGVQVLTLGQRKLWTESKGLEKPKGTVTIGGVIAMILVAWVLGALVVSGVVTKLITHFTMLLV